MNAGAVVVDLSIWQIALALGLVAALVVISLHQSLSLERDLTIGSIRTIVQLYGVGFLLAAVFAAARVNWVVLIPVAMTAVATHAAVSRLGRPLPGASWMAAAFSLPRPLSHSPTSSPWSSRCVPGGSRRTSFPLPA